MDPNVVALALIALVELLNQWAERDEAAAEGRVETDAEKAARRKRRRTAVADMRYAVEAQRRREAEAAEKKTAKKAARKG